MNRLLLHNALVVLGDLSTMHGAILVEGDTILRVAPDEELLAAVDGDSTVERIDCEGDLLMPGSIDTHVHFRDPGLTAKGDMATESRAALLGGVTSCIDMPNTIPATVTPGAWHDKMEAAKEKMAVNYAFFPGVTNDNIDSLVDGIPARHLPGIKLFLGSSTGNMLVDDQEALQHIFAHAPGVIAVHAEDEATIRARRADLESRYPAGNVPVELHSELRPAEACLKASRRAIELARLTGARLHLLHISTAAELNLLQPGSVNDKKITSETCPHYLLFESGDLAKAGARLKCNPAIKSSLDREALLRAVKDGVIDTLATDHAPHLPADKEGDLFKAASGMPGVQFALPLMLSLGISPERLAQLTASNPAKIFAIDRRGSLAPGFKADIVRIKHLSTPHVITDADVASRCGWTPFQGLQLTHAVIDVWVNGTHSVANGNLTGLTAAEPLTFNKL